MKNKILLIVTGVGCAGGLLYLSRTAEAPRNDQVQGIIGAKLLGRGSTVCVNKFQNTSGVSPLMLMRTYLAVEPLTVLPDPSLLPPIASVSVP